MTLQQIFRRIKEIRTVGDARRAVDACIEDLERSLREVVPKIGYFTEQHPIHQKVVSGHLSNMRGKQPHFASGSTVELGAETVKALQPQLNTAYIDMEGAAGAASVQPSYTEFFLDEARQVIEDPRKAVKRTTDLVKEVGKTAGDAVGDVVGAAGGLTSKVLWEALKAIALPLALVGGLLVVGAVAYTVMTAKGKQVAGVSP